MELGCVASGIIRTFRYFRGSEVVFNKNGNITVERNTKGGIAFFFEIDYKKMELLFSSSITREDDNFDKKLGRDICAQRAANDCTKTYKIPYTQGPDLLEQVFTMLTNASETGELGDKPYLRTLLSKMRLYDQQNADSACMYQDMLDSGVITIAE
jgi:hypothetical protein